MSLGLLGRHRRDCQAKQHERRERIDSLRIKHGKNLTTAEKELLDSPIDTLVDNVHTGFTSPLDILRSYAKAAIISHDRTNCITEVMVDSAERWLQDGSVNLQGPLAGVPVSLKDSINVQGYDTSVGYSGKTFKPVLKVGGMVKLLKDAGAVPFVKTALPITLLSFESSNDLWGQCKNPHNTKYSPGGSSGGEGALLAYGGSRVGIGSDVAGSVRVPAHFSGCYSLRPSTGRWIKAGIDTSMPGQEGIPSVFGPMARTLHDLTYFSKSVIQCRPWKYDHSVHPVPWRDEVYEATTAQSRKLRIGVMRTDGVVDPSPACQRALKLAESSLKAQGHEIIDISPPHEANPREALLVAAQLLNADGTKTFSSQFRFGEKTDPGAAQLTYVMKLPSPVRYLFYLFTKYIRGDSLMADVIRVMSPKSAYENWKLVTRREQIRASWFDWWTSVIFPSTGSTSGKSSASTSPPTSSTTSFATLSDEAKHLALEKESSGDNGGMDAILTVPNATPALPHGAMKDAVSSCGYTFLFNLLDYSCGIVPVTHVDPEADRLSEGFNARELNGIARGAYKHYDADKMAGLPVGVQVVCRRLEEEKVLGIMKKLEDALDAKGLRYKLMENF